MVYTTVSGSRAFLLVIKKEVAVQLLRMLPLVIGETDSEADVNGDGVVNVLYLVQIANYI